MAVSAARQCLKGNQIVQQRSRLPPVELWRQYTRHRFGLSPPGNGEDCHRTWEMLFFNMIPIVKSGPLVDSLFSKFELPVVIVKDWKEVCQVGFLEEQYQRVKHLLPIPNEKLTTAYYLRRTCPECFRNSTAPSAVVA